MDRQLHLAEWRNEKQKKFRRFIKKKPIRSRSSIAIPLICFLIFQLNLLYNLSY